MIDIQALRRRLANGESATTLAAEIMAEPEIVSVGFRYECETIANRTEIVAEGSRYNLNWMLDRLEAWRKVDMR